MHVVALGVEHPTEGPLLAFGAGEDRRGVVVAGLAHHVDHPAAADGVEDGLDFVDRERHRHRRIHVLARLEGCNRLRSVRPPLREDRDRVDVGGEQRVDVVERAGKIALADQGSGPFGDHVGDVDVPDSGVQGEQGGEVAGELPGSDDADGDHGCAFLSRGRRPSR